MAEVQVQYQGTNEAHNELYCVDGQPYTGLFKDNLGECLIEKRFQNGQLHGVQKTFYKTGQLKIASVFTNGKENGRRVEYYECGSKKLSSNFTDGHQSGVQEEYCREGSLKARKTFYNGKLIAIKGNI